MADQIEYIIIDKQSYTGDISNISMKSGSRIWLSQFQQKQIIIKGQFKDPAYITKLQYKGHHTDILKVLLLDADHQNITQVIKTIGKSQSNSMTTNVQAKIRAQYFEIILISNDGQAKKMGLNYVIFKGQKQPLQIQRPKIGNLSKQHTFKNEGQPQRTKYIPPTSVPYKNMFNRIREKQIFNQRNKKRPQSKEVQQDVELKKALELSEQQYKKQLKKNPSQKVQIQIDQSTTQPPLTQQILYQTVTFKQIKKSIMYVNQKWLQAQRRAEQQAGVKEHERLSNYVQVRHLHNRKILVEGIFGQRRAKIEGLIQILGAEIIKKPEDYCYIIGQSLDYPEIRKAISNFKGVKALNQNFLIQCKKSKCCLDFKDYMLKK